MPYQSFISVTSTLRGRGIGKFQARIQAGTVARCTPGEVLAAAQGLPNLCIETSGLLGLNCVSLAAERIGIDRLLFGSNAPLYCPVCGLENLAVSGLSDPDREKVLGANAARAFGVDLGKP